MMEMGETGTKFVCRTSRRALHDGESIATYGEGLHEVQEEEGQLIRSY